MVFFTRLGEYSATAIPARAGISKGTLYLYFHGKEELFEAVVRATLLPNLERIEALAATFEGPSAALLERLLLTLAGVLGSPAGAIPKLVIAEAGNFPQLARFYLDEVIRRGLRLIGAILRRGIARGEFRPIDVDHAVFCVIAPVTSDPEGALLPAQPPDAVHEVAFVAFHVRVLVCPLVTAVGLALIWTAGRLAVAVAGQTAHCGALP